MIANLTIVDDFFPDPQVVREMALSHDFTQEPEHDGHKYPGFAPVKDDRFLRYLEGLLLQSTGTEFSIRMAHFAAGTADHRTVQWIHADNGCAKFAGVVYLFDEPGCGTAFWQSADTKAHGLKDHLEWLKIPDKGWVENIAYDIQEAGKSQDHWTRTDYADSRFNRLIVYPTDRFHSRWPEHGFGDKPENCRLTLAIFFDLA